MLRKSLTKMQSQNTAFGLKHFLQLIRFKNLLMLVLVQTLFWLRFNDNSNTIHFFLLIISTIFLAAAGNVINDYFDVDADKINKPDKVIVERLISKKRTLIIYNILNLLGIFSGFFLAMISNKKHYGLLFIAISILLFYYSKYFKKTALVGNFIVAFFIAFSILIILIFPSVHLVIVEEQIKVMRIIVSYTIFAFLLNLIREIVKDIEDIDGDYKLNMKTLPILLGKKRSQNVVFYISLILFFLLILWVSIIDQLYFYLFAVVFLIIPLGYFILNIKEVKTKKELHNLSTMLKVIMLFGMLSILVLKF